MRGAPADDPDLVAPDDRAQVVTAGGNGSAFRPAMAVEDERVVGPPDAAEDVDAGAERDHRMADAALRHRRRALPFVPGHETPHVGLRLVVRDARGAAGDVDVVTERRCGGVMP